jgi:hypothetical protein
MWPPGSQPHRCRSKEKKHGCCTLRSLPSPVATCQKRSTRSICVHVGGSGWLCGRGTDGSPKSRCPPLAGWLFCTTRVSRPVPGVVVSISIPNQPGPSHAVDRPGGCWPAVLPPILSLCSAAVCVRHRHTPTHRKKSVTVAAALPRQRTAGPRDDFTNHHDDTRVSVFQTGPMHAWHASTR